jgi:hypothetical protein
MAVISSQKANGSPVTLAITQEPCRFLPNGNLLFKNKQLWAIYEVKNRTGPHPFCIKITQKNGFAYFLGWPSKNGSGQCRANPDTGEHG